jgi:hypothetical protein
MKKGAILTLVLIATLACGYSLGVVCATRKYVREESLRPAMIAIALEKATEAKDQTKIQNLKALQLRSAIEGSAALGDVSWPSIILGSIHNADGYPQFMSVIAEYTEKNPDLSISNSARTYIYSFKTTEPNQSLQTTTMAVTDAAAQPPRQP